MPNWRFYTPKHTHTKKKNCTHPNRLKWLQRPSSLNLLNLYCLIQLVSHWPDINYFKQKWTFTPKCSARFLVHSTCLFLGLHSSSLSATPLSKHTLLAKQPITEFVRTWLDGTVAVGKALYTPITIAGVTPLPALATQCMSEIKNIKSFKSSSIKKKKACWPFMMCPVKNW